jgi:3-deoxy-D-manno-octulosonate 8-phosphate phosphatase (KDO 8-P phosphatase)
MKIKMVCTDVDGTLTDGSVYYSERGAELKKFSAIDGRGFHLLKAEGIVTMMITSEIEPISRARANRLKSIGVLDYYFEDVKKDGGKLALVKKTCAERCFELSEVAYIGDDTNDKEAMAAIGFSACPSDANEEIKKISHLILNNKGGENVFREFVDLIIKKVENV